MRKGSTHTSTGIMLKEDKVLLSLTDHQTGQTLSKDYNQKEFMWLLSRMLETYFHAWGRNDDN